jgi:hypothetical protein
MNTRQKLSGFSLVSFLLAFSAPAFSDQVINDDLIVTGDTCVGSDCADGEEFAFLGLKIKNEHPQILFDDTSGGTFPANPWMVGITDNGTAEPANFVINDAGTGSNVLVLVPGMEGGIALGSGSAVETNAVSVGDTGTERRIRHVAEGIEDTDAVNKVQLESRISTLSDSVDDRIEQIEARIDDLVDRINDL